MKITIFFFLTLLSLTSFSQEDETEIKRDRTGRDKIKAAHAAYITERIELTSAEAEKFWPVYREYADKRRAIRQQFNEARRRGDAEKKLLALDLEIKQNMLDLEKTYSLRLQEIISPEKMIKLRQAEIDFRKLVFRHLQRRQK